jgi:hypothetical protein
MIQLRVLIVYRIEWETSFKTVIWNWCESNHLYRDWRKHRNVTEGYKLKARLSSAAPPVGMTYYFGIDNRIWLRWICLAQNWVQWPAFLGTKMKDCPPHKRKISYQFLKENSAPWCQVRCRHLSSWTFRLLNMRQLGFCETSGNTHWRGVTFQKTWYFIHTAAKIKISQYLNILRIFGRNQDGAQWHSFITSMSLWL